MTFCPDYTIKKPSWRHPFKRIAYHWRLWYVSWQMKRALKRGIKLPLIKNSDHGMSIDDIVCGPDSQSFVKTNDIPWKKGTEYLP